MQKIDPTAAQAALDAVIDASNTGPGGVEGYIQALILVFASIADDHGPAAATFAAREALERSQSLYGGE
jgi:hypothetical protein